MDADLQALYGSATTIADKSGILIAWESRRNTSQNLAWQSSQTENRVEDLARIVQNRTDDLARNASERAQMLARIQTQRAEDLARATARDELQLAQWTQSWDENAARQAKYDANYAAALALAASQRAEDVALRAARIAIEDQRYAEAVARHNELKAIQERQATASENLIAAAAGLPGDLTPPPAPETTRAALVTRLVELLAPIYMNRNPAISSEPSMVADATNDALYMRHAIQQALAARDQLLA